ncbi:MAG: tripartite tricarboxylate transporter substrate-binding protein [Alcanivoracaceae bacterium]
MPEMLSRPIVSAVSGLLLIACSVVPSLAWAQERMAKAGDFPAQPIRIVVYTSPGGLIDFTARRFADIARKYQADYPFVVINRPGGGGIVAFEDVLQMPADGYTMLAVTRSNISKMVATGREDLIDQIDWHSYIMDNPHVLITNLDGGPQNWQELHQDAIERGGRQLWLGADIGGVKHVSGVKMARQAGIDVRWIPYSSGGQAVAALLGNLGAAYLGNPRDALISDKLDIVAVAAATRLERFPDSPTFAELGIPGLKEEIIWRGFAFRKGVPENIRAWYSELIRKVTSDPDWIDGWADEGVNLDYRSATEFATVVSQDREEFSFYLREIGLLREAGTRETLLSGIGEAPARQFFTAIIVLINLLLGAVLMKSSFRNRAGELMILIATISLAILFYVMTAALPPPSPVDTIGASGVPRLWIALLLPLAIYQMYLLARKQDDLPPRKRSYLLFTFAGAMTAYVLLIPILGYLLASAIFMPATLWALHYRRPLVVTVLTGSWLIFSYYIFQKILYVDLPTGMLL